MLFYKVFVKIQYLGHIYLQVNTTKILHVYPQAYSNFGKILYLASKFERKIPKPQKPFTVI